VAIEPWETLASELVFDHRWYRLRRDTVRLPGGRVLDDYLVSVRPDYAVVVALTPEDEVVLARQWKQGIGAFTLELPGGVIDGGEKPAGAAERELREETGYVARALVRLGSLEVDPSKNTNRAHVFLGRDAKRVHVVAPDENEVIEVVLLPLAGVRAAIAAGTVSAAVTVTGLLLALEARGL